eukprot:415380_1
MSALFHLCCFISCVSLDATRHSKFANIPHELISDIFSTLPFDTKINSVSLLNKAGYNHFKSYHQQEIQLFQQLKHEIQFKCLNYASDKIRRITIDLQFSELYALQLPSLLKLIFNKKHEIDRICLLYKMNIHSMSMSELNVAQNQFNFSSELSILLLASRALLHYYIPDNSINIQTIPSYHIMRFPGTDQNYVYLDEYPWIVTILSNLFSDRRLLHDYWVIYMSYLYEVTFDLGYNNFDIPSLNSVFKHQKLYENDDYRKKETLRYFRYFGLILWHRKNINDLRAEFFMNHGSKYNFYHFVLEADRINAILFGNRNVRFAYETQVMTKFMLDIVNKYDVNVSFNMSDILEINAMRKTVKIVDEYRLDNYLMKEMQSYDQLAQIIIKMHNVIINNRTSLEFSDFKNVIGQIEEHDV